MADPFKKVKIQKPSLTKEEFKPKQKIYKAEGGRIGFAHGSKRPKGGWTA